MSEELLALFEAHRDLALRVAAGRIEMAKLRKAINEKMDAGGYGMIVGPYYTDWRSRS